MRGEWRDHFEALEQRLVAQEARLVRIEETGAERSEGLRRIEEKMDRRDKTLFGEDGRGGLVADVNAAKNLGRAAMWLIGTGAAGLLALASWVSAHYR